MMASTQATFVQPPPPPPPLNPFEIPELLELLLLNLPTQDVFNLQRVSRKWRDVVASAPRLRWKLFLDNPAGDNVGLVLNPFVPEMVPKRHIKGGLRFLTGFLTLAWAYPRATWLRMMLFTPGAAQARVRVGFNLGDALRQVLVFSVRGERGRSVTVGDLLAAVKKSGAERMFRVDKLEKVELGLGAGGWVVVYRK